MSFSSSNCKLLDTVSHIIVIPCAGKSKGVADFTDCTFLGEAAMNIEVAGNAAIWSEKEMMRVVVLSGGGLRHFERKMQFRALRTLIHADCRGTLYDARQVEGVGGKTTDELCDHSVWSEWGCVAVVVRSQWTAFCRNIVILVSGHAERVRVFSDGDTAKKWLKRPHSMNRPASHRFLFSSV